MVSGLGARPTPLLNLRPRVLTSIPRATLSLVGDMFRQPTHVDAYLTPMAEAVYAVTILGTEVALANFDDGRDPERTLCRG